MPKATASVAFGSGCPALTNDQELCGCIQTYTEELLGQDKAFSGLQKPSKASGYPQHHPMVRFDENILAEGSAVYAYTAMRWLEDH